MNSDISMLGVLLSPTDIDFGSIFIIYLTVNLILFVTIGFLFAIKSLKMDDKRVKLRGKFLLLAFILFLFGAILELIITFPQNRIILIISGILYYFGFIMPDKMVKRLISE